MIIGNNITVGQSGRIRVAPCSKIVIEDDCMFSSDVIIQSGSGHSLFDIEAQKSFTLNSKNIIIHKHVWLGDHTVIFDGADIGSGSVVGINSFINKFFPNNSCIAGNPARIIRKKVAWRREFSVSYNSYEDFKLFDYTLKE